MPAEWIPVFRAESFDEQDSLISSLFANFLPAFFENCEALLRARGGSHFGGGDELTYADICVFQGRRLGVLLRFALLSLFWTTRSENRRTVALTIYQSERGQF